MIKTFEEWCGEKGIKIEEVSAILLPTAYKVWGTECYHEAKELKSENEALRNEADENAALSMQNKMRADRLEKENAALRERLEKAVVFPIKFGDKIYTINFQKPKAQWSVRCGVVKTISVTQTPDKTQFVFRVKIKYRDAREYVLGKSAFLSKEAAEARLAELKGGDHE